MAPKKVSLTPPDSIEAILELDSKDKLEGKYNMLSFLARIRKLTADKYGNRIKLQPGRGWKGILELYPALRMLHGIHEHEKASGEAIFTSDRARIIYALTQLDGEHRARELGLTGDLFDNPEKARKWMKELSKMIHPDQNGHPLAEEAQQKLNMLYERITG